MVTSVVQALHPCPHLPSHMSPALPRVQACAPMRVALNCTLACALPQPALICYPCTLPCPALTCILT